MVMKFKSLVSLVFGIGVVFNLHAQILPAVFGAAAPSRPVASNLGSSGPLITSGLVLHLDAGNTSSYSGSGTTWTDLSGNNNHGTLINGPTYSSTNGGSLVLDGSNDYIDFGNSASLRAIGGTTNITVSAWVYYSAYGGGGQSYSVITVKGAPWTWLLENYLDTFRFRIVAGGADVSVGDVSTHQLNVWYNVVGTYDGSNMRLYINGVLKNTVPQTGTLATNTETAKIGTWQGTNYNLTGRVSNVFLYNRVLTASEVLQNYNALLPRFLSIGDNYGGGKLAYVLKAGDPGYDATTPHGLIAAIADHPTRIQWWNGSYITTGATATALGTGLTNTNAIIAAQGTGSYAASVARNHTGGGYTDWYLPSKDELEKLRINKNAIGGFGGDWYYSSSENTGTSPATAWLIGNSSGTWWPNVKHEAWSVRPVRAF
jgi:hypothetical protein